MTRKILHECDICGLEMDSEFSAHMEVYAIGEICDEPRTDLCPGCWGIGKTAMIAAVEEEGDDSLSDAGQGVSTADRREPDV